MQHRLQPRFAQQEEASHKFSRSRGLHRLQAGCGNVVDEHVVHVVVHGSFVDHDSAPLKVGQRDADESRTAADEARCK